MKKIIIKYFKIVFVFLLIFIFDNSISKATTFEIWIENRVVNTDIFIKFYPVGSLFNGGDLNYSPTIDYSLIKTTDQPYNPTVRRGPGSELLKYIVGLDGHALDGRYGGKMGFFKLYFNSSNGYKECKIASDASNTGNQVVDGIFGFGRYMLEIYTDEIIPVLKAQIPIDWGDFRYIERFPLNANMQADLFIYIYDINNSPPTINYQWASGNPVGLEKYLYEDSTANGHIEVYRQFYGNRSPNLFTPDTSYAISDTRSNVFNYPLNATQLPNGYATYEHLSSNSLYRNLEIESQKKTHVTNFNSFKIEDNTKIRLLEAISVDWTRFIVDSLATFISSGSSTIDMKPFSELVIEEEAIWLDGCGEIVRNNPSCIIVRGQHIISCDNLQRTINNGGFEILEGGHLSISDNSRIIYDGQNSYLKLTQNSSIIFGENSSLEFKNGAYISANGCTFNSIDSLKKWKGIVLENSGVDSIVNCTFSNAKTAITIKNTYGSYVNRVIKNNTFNIPTGGDHKGIYGENNYNILIQDNTFNMPVVNQGGSPYYSGIFLKNSGSGESSGQTEEESMPFPYSLNIVNNTFKNGSVSMILANYLSNVLPYYVKGNSFDSSYSVGLLGLKITGTIRDNVSSDFMTPLGFHLVNSSPNLYNNTVIARDVSLHLIGNSYPNLSPYIYGNQLTWTGGKNRFTSLNYDNIQLVHPANVYTDFGENRFTIFDTASAYHIYGWLDSTITKYAGRNNCWYPANTAKIYLRHSLTGNPVSTVTGVTTLDCDHEIDPNGWSVDYLGNGIYDSVK